MRLTFQLVIEPDDQPPVITDLLSVEQSDLDAGSLGLHLNEAHELLNHGQSAMVTAQVSEFVDNVRQCPECHRHLGCKGHHEVVHRTVFGTLHIDSPRLYHCPDCQGKRASFSPLAQSLTERTSPELQYLQTKFASLMPYGVTIDILSEVLPLGETLATLSVKHSSEMDYTVNGYWTGFISACDFRILFSWRKVCLETTAVTPLRKSSKIYKEQNGICGMAALIERCSD